MTTADVTEDFRCRDCLQSLTAMETTPDLFRSRTQDGRSVAIESDVLLEILKVLRRIDEKLEVLLMPSARLVTPERTNEFSGLSEAERGIDR